jgi:hypothetical protein
MRDVKIGDLENPNRLAVLFDEAKRRGLVKRCEADELAFFAAAERAKRVATRNAPGCFVRIVRKGCFSFAAQQDEDLARARISALRELGSACHRRGDQGGGDGLKKELPSGGSLPGRSADLQFSRSETGGRTRPPRASLAA